jgi:hypothetical protein
MDDPDDKVVPLWTSGSLPRKVTGDGQLWPLTLRQAIFPAFRLCQKQLAAKGRKTNICEAKGRHAPFVVLFWSGKHSLAGMSVGLQFAYGGEGRFSFDVSAAHRDGTCRHQTSFHKEYFPGDDPDFPARILMMSAFGIGLSQAMEASPLFGATWHSTRIERARQTS